jgi:hypothetical protein
MGPGISPHIAVRDRVACRLSQSVVHHGFRRDLVLGSAICGLAALQKVDWTRCGSRTPEQAGLVEIAVRG